MLVECTRVVAVLPSLGKGKMIAEEDGVFEYPRSNVVLYNGVGPCGTLALKRQILPPKSLRPNARFLIELIWQKARLYWMDEWTTGNGSQTAGSFRGVSVQISSAGHVFSFDCQSFFLKMLFFCVVGSSGLQKILMCCGLWFAHPSFGLITHGRLPFQAVLKSDISL